MIVSQDECYEKAMEILKELKKSGRDFGNFINMTMFSCK